MGITDGSQVKIHASTVTVYPAQELHEGQKYTVKVKPGFVEDRDQNPFAGGFPIYEGGEFSFTVLASEERVVVLILVALFFLVVIPMVLGLWCTLYRYILYPGTKHDDL